MDKKKLAKHVKLCKRNLRSDRVVCCANCPFEEEIVGEYPELEEKFNRKRLSLEGVLAAEGLAKLATKKMED